MIEIENETRVKEVITFIHPIYHTFQMIYIADDFSLMLERLINLKVKLYTKGKTVNGHVTWTIAKRINNFPNNLSDISSYLYLYTPNLQKYLNFDLKRGRFYIHESLNNQSVEIPTSLMDPTTEVPKDVIRRFRWISNDSFLVANGWGFEKLIQIRGTDFVEIS